MTNNYGTRLSYDHIYIYLHPCIYRYIPNETLLAIKQRAGHSYVHGDYSEGIRDTHTNQGTCLSGIHTYLLTYLKYEIVLSSRKTKPSYQSCLRTNVILQSV